MTMFGGRPVAGRIVPVFWGLSSVLFDSLWVYEFESCLNQWKPEC